VGRFEASAVIEAHVAAYDPHYQLATLAFSGGQLIAANLDAPIGRLVRVRIRARDVTIATAPPTDISASNVCRGKVTEMRAEEGAILDMRIQVGEQHLLARVTRRSADQLGLAVGRDVFAIVKTVSIDRHSIGMR
jgi:molybdate transport system ATP-binding protein